MMVLAIVLTVLSMIVLTVSIFRSKVEVSRWIIAQYALGAGFIVLALLGAATAHQAFGLSLAMCFLVVCDVVILIGEARKRAE